MIMELAIIANDLAMYRINAQNTRHTPHFKGVLFARQPPSPTIPAYCQANAHFSAILKFCTFQSYFN